MTITGLVARLLGVARLFWSPGVVVAVVRVTVIPIILTRVSVRDSGRV